MKTNKFFKIYIGLLLITLLAGVSFFYWFVTIDDDEDITNKLKVTKEEVYDEFHNNIKDSLKAKYVTTGYDRSIIGYDENFEEIYRQELTSTIFRNYDINDMKVDKNGNIWFLINSLRLKEDFQQYYPTKDIVLVNKNNPESYKLITFDKLHSFSQVCFDNEKAYVGGNSIGSPYLRISSVNLENYSVIEYEEEYKKVNGRKPHQIVKIFCEPKDNLIVFSQKGIYKIKKDTFEIEELFYNEKGYLYDYVYDETNNNIYFKLNEFDLGNKDYLSVYDITNNKFEFKIIKDAISGGLYYHKENDTLYTTTQPLGRPHLEKGDIGPNGEISSETQELIDNYEKKIKTVKIDLNTMNITYIDNKNYVIENFVLFPDRISTDEKYKILEKRVNTTKKYVNFGLFLELE